VLQCRLRGFCLLSCVQGTVYHMVIRYKTEHDIREELGNHNW
jgi:hypothetical protein